MRLGLRLGIGRLRLHFTGAVGMKTYWLRRALYRVLRGRHAVAGRPLHAAVVRGGRLLTALHVAQGEAPRRRGKKRDGSKQP